MSGSRRLAAALVISLLAAACGSPTASESPASSQSSPAASPATARNADTQTSEGGEVTVEVAWAGAPSGATFDVKLDTHSIELDGVDLTDSVLRNDRGETLRARPWAAPAGGHHREGQLSFDGDAEPFFAGATWFELVINGVGGVPQRVLRWELAP